MADNFELPQAGAAPHDASGSHAPSYQVVVSVFMIVTLLATAVFVGRQEAKAKAAAPAAAAAPATATAAPAAPAPGEALASDLKEMRSQVESLPVEIKRLQGMIDGLPKPEPAPDLKPIQDKVDDLARSVAAAMPLVEKMDKIEGHVSGIGKQIEGLEANVLVLKQGLGAISRKSAR